MKTSCRAGVPARTRQQSLRLLTLFITLIFGTQFAPPKGLAQVVTGTLTGTVTDATGATVPNATVIATDQSTGVSQSTTTTANGIYNFSYLQPASYRLSVEASGFKRFVQENVVLNVSTVQRIDAALSPGNVQETVTVTSETPLLQTEGAEVARNFSSQTAQELPVANRNFQALAGLVAGVSPPVQSFTSLEDPQGKPFSMRTGREIRQTTRS